MVNYGNPAGLLEPSGDTSGVTDYPRLVQAFKNGTALGQGTFWTNQPIPIPGGAVIPGQGIGLTVIKQAAGANLPAVAATSGWTTSSNATSVPPVYIRGVSFDGNTANQTAGTGHGVVLQNYNSYIEDCSFNNTRGDGLRFDYYGANGSSGISNTMVENRVTGCQFRFNGSGLGINVNDPTFNTITDGYIGGLCIFQSSGLFLGAAAGWWIDGNHLYGSPQSAIRIARPFMTRVTNNYVEDWGTSSTFGFWAAIDAGNDTVNDTGAGSSVTGNTINLNNPAGNASSFLVGLQITGTDTAGGQGTFAVAGNMFAATDNTHPGQYTGISLFNQGSQAAVDTMLAGNLFTGHWGNGLITANANGGTMTITALNSNGSNSSGSAPVLTALGAVSGTAIQLSDTTRDYMVYLEVTTAGTATSIALGPTSAVSAVTILSSVAVAAGDLYSFRLPAGWFFKWTGTTTAIGNQNAVGC